jgi:hypothetical protein
VRLSNKVLALAVAAAALAIVPLSSATSLSFNLTSNNLGISGSVGTVTITDSGLNTVTVSISMNAGYSIKLQGGDIAFNGPSNLSASSYASLQGSFGSETFADLSFKGFKSPQHVSQFGDFAFDYMNISGQKHELNGVTSLTSLTFTLTASGLTASQFTSVGIHFCTAADTTCSKITGFASGSPSVPPTVPEPGTLGMLGTGLIGLAAIVRKRVRERTTPQATIAE